MPVAQAVSASSHRGRETLSARVLLFLEGITTRDRIFPPDHPGEHDPLAKRLLVVFLVRTLREKAKTRSLKERETTTDVVNSVRLRDYGFVSVLARRLLVKSVRSVRSRLRSLEAVSAEEGVRYATHTDSRDGSAELALAFDRDCAARAASGCLTARFGPPRIQEFVARLWF